MKMGCIRYMPKEQAEKVLTKLQSFGGRVSIRLQAQKTKDATSAEEIARSS